MALTKVHTDLIEGSFSGGDGVSEELQVDTFTGDGTTVTFGLTRLPEHANNTQVYVSGVYQQKDTYTVSGLALTFSEAPAVGESIEAVVAYVNPMYSGDHVKKVNTYNHNILINPSFTVFQRAGTTNSGDWGVDHPTASYGPDRWGVSGVSSTGGSKSESSTAVDDTTGTHKLVVKHLNATSSAHVYQRVEAVNLQGLYGKEMTLSFSFSNTGTPELPNVRIYTWNDAGDYSIIHEAVPTSLGNNRFALTFTLSTDDGTIPAAADVGLGVTIYSNENKTDPAPDEWSLWETKLEAGSVATPFIARSHSEELALCHRYFYSWKTDTSTKTDYFEGSPSYSWPSLNMPTPMRAKPAATIYSYTTRYTAPDDNSEVTRTVESASVKGGWFNTTRSGDFIMTSCALKCSSTGLFTKQGGYSGMMGDFDAEL